MLLPYTSYIDSASCNLKPTLYDPNPYLITSYATSCLENIFQQQVVKQETSEDVLQINIKKKQFKLNFNL